MNKDQYERESVLRALQRHDSIIESLEQALAVAHESRREFVNRHDLNKSCQHTPKVYPAGSKEYEHGAIVCTDCGFVMANYDDDAHAHMVD